MANIDKRLYTKEEWHRIRAERRKEKAQKPKIQTTEQPKTNVNSNAPIAFVLGNGTSRKPVPLPSLKERGTVYACNAVYRDFNPDYLVAVDTKMVLEIAQSGYQTNNQVWTNPNKVYSNIKNLNFFDPPKGWSSGPTALDMASRHGFREIYILGFDYKGLGDKINNMFADTKNYKRSADRATYYGNWLRQTAITIEKNKQTRYIRVIKPNDFVPPELLRLQNVEHIAVEKFMKQFNIS
jgi:hypothetical protein